MEKETANIILGKAGPSDKFQLKWLWFTFNLEIKPLTARQLIEISGEVAKIRDINEQQEMFPALMEGVVDARYMAKVIAIATGSRFRRIVAYAVLDLDLKDIKTLFEIVHKQSDPTPFFFTTLLAKGRMNLMKKSQGEQ